MGKIQRADSQAATYPCHPCELKPTSGIKNWKCDFCAKEAPTQDCFTCEPCDFDVCDGCKTHLPPKKTCVHKCELKYFEDVTSGIMSWLRYQDCICDICEENCTAGYSCQDCSFDLCKACCDKYDAETTGEFDDSKLAQAKVDAAAEKELKKKAEAEEKKAKKTGGTSPALVPIQPKSGCWIISAGGQEIKLKVVPGITADTMIQTIRARYGISAEESIYLEDSDEAVALMSPNLPLGKYTLYSSRTDKQKPVFPRD